MKTESSSSIPARTAKVRPLRLGFVPLADCAPLVMAHELGLFRKYDLRVVLSRELGWATIRDKIIHGELDAAQALAAMPFAATIGLGSVRCDCLAALVLNLHGNAITLSNTLQLPHAPNPGWLADAIRRSRLKKTFTFAAVSQVSSHWYLLRAWLAAAGVDPDRDVRIVVVPPPQMVVNLKAGHLDGFCAGEPWNSVAAQQGIGWCVAASAELRPGHPEKVLMVRREFAEQRSPEHLALVAALLEACEYCDAPENHERLAATLARPGCVEVAPEILRRSFKGDFDFGHGRVRTVPDACVFHRDEANEPSSARAGWVLQLIRAGGLCPDPAALDSALARQVFRADLFDRAARLRGSYRFNHEKKSQAEPELAAV